MAVTTTQTNKPINPRGNDQSPKGYNRAELYTGKALDFDGVNDDITTTITISGAKTYCAWVNADGTDNERIISISGSGYSNITFSNNKFGMYDGTNIPETTTTFETDQWYFVVGVQEANNAKIYVNGINQPLSTTNWIERTHTGATLAIGRDGAGAAAYYDGEIAGVKIFNTALTAAQVADLYNNPEKVVPTGVDNTALKLWLPMQEGAGTTAYDGSGNGNHGTISGATWTHGIGAPVSQTAVIDWNKGTNLVTYSEDFSQWGTNDSPVVTASSTIAPDGSTNAYEITDNTSSGYARIKSNTVTMSGNYIGSVYIKKTTGSLSHYPGFDIGSPGYYVIVDTTNGTAVDTGSHYSDITVTSYNDTWWRVSAKSNVTTTNNAIRFWPALSDNGTTISASATGSNTFWGAQVEKADAIGSYVYTGATAQTSEVLLPQGLTSGRDITGVNLFENVRKQGALNLDGNSWAEVYDNASLDITDEVTLEAWVYYVNDTSMLEHIIGKRASSGSWLRIYSASANSLRVERDGGNSTSDVSITENAWSHIVATIDTSDTVRFYVNGTQQTSAASFTPWSMSNTAPVSIGAWVKSVTPSTNSYLNGAIAQPRIYNRALTAAEVLQNYNSGKSIYTNS